MSDATELIDRFQRRWDEDALFRSIWQDEADYIMPRKSNIIYINPTPGRKQTQRLFDSTAIHCNELLAASICSSITPSNGKFFYLKLRDETLNENQEVKQWLEDCGNRMEVALHQSNFQSESHEGYLDAGCFGQMALFGRENPLTLGRFSGVNFKALTIGEYCICEDENERVNTVFRKFQMSAQQAKRKFTDSRDKLPERIEKAAESSKDRDRKFDFLWATLPRDEWKPGRKMARLQPYSSVYVSLDERKVIRDKGFLEFPHMVARWGKTSGECNGRGPGDVALPDIKTLNRAKELGLTDWALSINPPIAMRDQGVIGSLKWGPSAINYTRGDPNQVIALLYRNQGSVQKDTINVQELKQSIREMFFADQLQMPALKDSKQMTAAEVYVRYELMNRILGPTLGRFEVEYLNPLIEWLFGVMWRAKAFLPMPDILKRNMAEGIIDIEYEGPLARAQRMGEVSAIEKFQGYVSQAAQIDPDVLDVLDMTAAVREYADVTGVPEKVMRKDADIARRRKDRAAAKAAEQKKTDMERMAAGMKNIAPAMGMMKDMMAQKGGQGLPQGLAIQSQGEQSNATM